MRYILQAYWKCLLEGAQTAQACRLRTRPAAHDAGAILWGRPALFDSPDLRYIPLVREEECEVVTLHGTSPVADVARVARLVREGRGPSPNVRAQLAAAEWDRLMGDGSSSRFTPSPASPDWWWPCARMDCPCPASWNGGLGEFCCLMCRDGVPCRAPLHVHPFGTVGNYSTPGPGPSDGTDPDMPPLESASDSD